MNRTLVTKKLSGWGRYPTRDCRLAIPADIASLTEVARQGPLIARGAGRAYGDSALNENLTVDMRRFNRMLAFDANEGTLVAEAGVTVGEIIQALLPRGWFPAVTPGTKFVTLGGMIAADVHGKNHHGAGSFGNYIDWVDLLAPSGETIRCSRQQNSAYFALTVGGMGLSGIILRARIRLTKVESGWMTQETIAAADLSSAMSALEASHDWTYSVAWIDSLAGGERLGRSLVYRAEHARPEDLDRKRRRAPFATPRGRSCSVPVDAPGWMLNRYTVRGFNFLYYLAGKARPAKTLIDWNRFFYPLDSLLHWNRLYGRQGLVQFQCVLPRPASRAGMQALLTETSRAGLSSFLAVLKLLGPQESAFSFPMEGYTLALDFPAVPKALSLLEKLERIAIEHDGRMYLAKDAHMSRSTLDASDRRVAHFREERKSLHLDELYASAQSERLAL